MKRQRRDLIFRYQFRHPVDGLFAANKRLDEKTGKSHPGSDIGISARTTSNCSALLSDTSLDDCGGPADFDRQRRLDQ